MILKIILIASLIFNGVLLYIARNAIQKNNVYEETIDEFYSSVSIVLHNMRAIDERGMFEADDDVGTVFAQLRDILELLRPMVYGDVDE